MRRPWIYAACGRFPLGGKLAEVVAAAFGCLRAAAGNLALLRRSSVSAKAEQSNSRKRTARPSGNSVVDRMRSASVSRFSSVASCVRVDAIY